MASARRGLHPEREAGSFSRYSRYSRYSRAAWAGLLGTTLLSVAASLPGSPFAFKVPGAWFFGAPSPGQGGGIAQADAFTLLVELGCGFAGIFLLCRAWLVITREVVREPGQNPRHLADIVVWLVPLLVAPPMFSDDIYSYAAQGEMVTHHIAPICTVPAFSAQHPSSRWLKGSGSTFLLPTAHSSAVSKGALSNSPATEL